jgi:uncharacterized protein
VHLPIIGVATLPLGVLFGFAFGFLLERGRLADPNVLINQLRLRDFTIVKVMLTAVIVGGIGVLLLHQGGLANYHIKPANLAGVGLGAALFGIGMAVSGYCPGTSLAAAGTGSVQAVVAILGMVLGAILYALSFDWVEATILGIAALGPVRLPEAMGIPDFVWFAALIVVAFALFLRIERPRAEHAGLRDGSAS